jgi:hypothetical protein
MKRVKKGHGLFSFLAIFLLLLSCSPEEELIIPSPEISALNSKYTILEGNSLELTPIVESNDETTYKWTLDGVVVANNLSYTFNAVLAGEYRLVFEAVNSGGINQKEITLVVVTGLTNIETNTFRITTLGVLEYFAEVEHVTWEVTSSSSELYRVSYLNSKNPMFVTAEAGEYLLKVSSDELEGEVTVLITVESSEQEPSPYIAEIFDFLPAPGQFVNKLPVYNEGDTRDDMVRKVGESLIGEDATMITLGGWGGYVEFGFDHTIVNVPGRRDFRIHGNAFAAVANPNPGAPFGGSCEPAIVMVAYDQNKNGVPDEDEWYEIRGSGSFTAENEAWYQMALDNGNDARTVRDYEMTYYRPASEIPGEDGETNNSPAFVSIQNYIKWTNNQGEEGYKVKNVYHSQSYYPAWIADDEITFSGLRMAENGIDESGKGNYFVLYAFNYGYVDNYPNNHDNSAIDIDWAIDNEGNKADLPGIDFVKVYNGVDQENGWLGEASTELSRGEDLHLLGKNIETIAQ